MIKLHDVAEVEQTAIRTRTVSAYNYLTYDQWNNKSQEAELELAWAAGFYDGEGCTYYGGGTAHIAVQQCDKNTLMRLRKALGRRGHINGPYIRSGHNQPVYTYAVGKREHIEEVMELLWPYLSGPKLQQAQEVLGY